jgi:hypothetical protein
VLAHDPDEEAWVGRVQQREVAVTVGGSSSGPDRARLEAVRTVLDRLDGLSAVLADHLAQDAAPLEAESGGSREVVHPAPPDVAVLHIESREPAPPDAITVIFTTGHRGATVRYRAVVEGREISEVSAHPG